MNHPGQPVIFADDLVRPDPSEAGARYDSPRMNTGRLVGGDVGGTKSLLRCVEPDGRVSAQERYESGGYGRFDEILADFLPKCPGPVDSACFAVAGAVIEGRAEVTNLGWSLETAALAEAFAIPHLALINDFHAIARGVPLLKESDLISLQRGRRDRNAPIAIIGAGTGLGEAAVAPHAGEWVVLPGEGGHGEFAPQDEEQLELLRFLMRRQGHVSWERVVSGLGIPDIFEFVTGHTEKPARISELAAAGDEKAVHAFRIFVDVYASEAGNMALRLLARGGVFLAGGIAAKNVPFFTDGRFVEAFVRKGRFTDLMREMPVDLIVNEEVGLIGAIREAQLRMKN